LTDIRNAGDTREILFAPIPTLAVGGGMVREILLTTPTAISFDGVAREVLLVGDPIVSARQTAVSVIT
jgi:hypothetical protein